MDNNEFPAGARVYREYQVRLQGGVAAHIAFTLADACLASPARSLARRLGAESFGLISLIESAPDRRYLLVWSHDDRELAITVVEADGPLRDELSSIVEQYICVFLADIAALVPVLADLAQGRPAGDIVLH